MTCTDSDSNPVDCTLADASLRTCKISMDTFIDCSVELDGKLCYDLDGNLFECDSVIWDVIHEYTVKTPRSIWGVSVQNILHTNINSTAYVEFSYPTEVQTSNTPLHGYYFIECYSEDGQ